jgi:hypothetical protein
VNVATSVTPVATQAPAIVANPFPDALKYQPAMVL